MSSRRLCLHLVCFRSILSDDFQYLLVTIEYEPFAHLGRPHSISYNAVKELFGGFSNVKFIAQVPAAAPLKSDWKENVFWMSGGEEDRVQYWQARWATGQSQWNSEKPHQYLVKVRHISVKLNFVGNVERLFVCLTLIF